MVGILRRAFVALVGRRSSPAIPAVCYSPCNDAYVAAQALGQSPLLCAANSSFAQSYETCVNCIKANGNNNGTLLSNVTSEFQPFILYCGASPAQTEIGGAAPTYLSAAKSSLLAQASSLGLTLVSTLQITVTVAQPFPSSTSSNSSLTSTHSKTTNPSWIAGAVVGPLAVVALGALAFWLRMRKKRRTAVIANEPQPDEKEKEKDLTMKAQLHGDSMPRHELEGHATTELDNNPVSELPALEPVGSELSAKKQEFIRRKPVGGTSSPTPRPASP